MTTLRNSITNAGGARANANHRWPGGPVARLRASGLRRGAANMGIAHPAEAYARYSGQSALRRYHRPRSFR